jgi:hypothetical protein
MAVPRCTLLYMIVLCGRVMKEKIKDTRITINANAIRMCAEQIEATSRA